MKYAKPKRRTVHRERYDGGTAQMCRVNGLDLLDKATAAEVATPQDERPVVVDRYQRMADPVYRAFRIRQRQLQRTRRVAEAQA